MITQQHLSTCSQARRLLAALTVVMLAGCGLLTLRATPAHAGELTPCPVEGSDNATWQANARFVRLVYLDVLERCPDKPGRNYWADQLTNGLPRDVLVATILFSDESLRRISQIWYQTLLGRAATPTELNDALALLRYDGDDTLLYAKLGASTEYFDLVADTHPVLTPDDAWVQDVFHGILDRDIDAGGQSYFRGIIGQPSTVFNRFVAAIVMGRSPEKAHLIATDLIHTILRRPADAGGVDYWANWLLQPGRFKSLWLQVILLSSDETYNQAQSEPGYLP